MDKVNLKRKLKIDITIIYDLLLILMGTYILSFAINVFLYPHKLSTGGASGIATIIKYIYNVPLGITVMIINIPLFVVAIFKLGLRFSAKAIITTTLLSIFLDIFTYESLIKIIDADLFISAIFGGLLCGLSLSILFKAGASSGGSDLLAQIIYKLTSIQSISQILLIIDTCIILSIVIVFKNVNLGLYSVVSIYISKKVIDVIFEGIYYTKIVDILTKNQDNIVDEILSDLKRGVTSMKVIGEYTKTEYTKLTVILTLPEIARIKRIVRKNDPKALMYISNANEVLGHGFKNL